MVGIKDGDPLSDILVDATISAGFGAMGGPIDVGILDDGFRATKTLMKKGLYPTVKKSAQKTYKKALKYAGKMALESLLEPVVGLLETGARELSERVFERYFAW